MTLKSILSTLSIFPGFGNGIKFIPDNKIQEDAENNKVEDYQDFFLSKGLEQIKNLDKSVKKENFFEKSMNDIYSKQLIDFNYTYWLWDNFINFYRNYITIKDKNNQIDNIEKLLMANVIIFIIGVLLVIIY